MLLERDTKKTVAKVKTQTWAGIITGLVVSALMAYGISATSVEITLIQAFGPIVLPVLIAVGVGYLRGYMKTDPEREELWNFAEGVFKAVEISDAHAIEEYVRRLHCTLKRQPTGE